MKESHVEGSAGHNGPESCGDAREGIVEALTGVRAGRVFSRESNLTQGKSRMRYPARPDPRRGRPVKGHPYSDSFLYQDAVAGATVRCPKSSLA